MKVWIALALAAFLVVAINRQKSQRPSEPAAITSAKTDAAVNDRIENKGQSGSTIKTEEIAKPEPSAQADGESVPETLQASPAEPVAGDLTSALGLPPLLQDPAPDLLKWQGGKKPEFDPDPIMELRTTETIRPDDGPVLTLTYGDEPQPNFKIEHRSWGNDKRPDETL